VHVRVVRFADVTPERAEKLLADIEASDAPPPGVPATGLQMLLDEDQRAAPALQLLDTVEDTRTGAARLLSGLQPSPSISSRSLRTVLTLRTVMRR